MDCSPRLLAYAYGYIKAGNPQSLPFAPIEALLQSMPLRRRPSCLAGWAVAKQMIRFAEAEPAQQGGSAEAKATVFACEAKPNAA